MAGDALVDNTLRDAWLNYVAVRDAVTPSIHYSADVVTSVPCELYFSADGVVTSVRVHLIT